jgi:hypothetical protein
VLDGAGCSRHIGEGGIHDGGLIVVGVQAVTAAEADAVFEAVEVAAVDEHVADDVCHGSDNVGKRRVLGIIGEFEGGLKGLCRLGGDLQIADLELLRVLQQEEWSIRQPRPPPRQQRPVTVDLSAERGV